MLFDDTVHGSQQNDDGQTDDTDGGKVKTEGQDEPDSGQGLHDQTDFPARPLLLFHLNGGFQQVRPDITGHLRAISEQMKRLNGKHRVSMPVANTGMDTGRTSRKNGTKCHPISLPMSKF